ncbi:hypothetical protein CSKR_201437, partial [Clonorchis sinensis]
MPVDIPTTIRSNDQCCMCPMLTYRLSGQEVTNVAASLSAVPVALSVPSDSPLKHL